MTYRPGELLLAAIMFCSTWGCATTLQPGFHGLDRDRNQVSVQFEAVMAGGKAVTAKMATGLDFLPGSSEPILIISEKRGRIDWVRLSDGKRGNLLEITRIGSSYPEKGLVGFVFHPDYESNRKLYTYHLRATRDGGQSVISEWEVEGDNIEAMSIGKQRIVFELEQTQEGHNGGQVAFGPDGYLYVGFGDGGSQKDPLNRGQDTTNHYGTMIRIDPAGRSDGKEYSIPEDNPFLSGGHLPEVWAYGLRNPWRFAFGPNGQLVAADVGQDKVEEIDVILPGRNYGWCIREGSQAHKKCKEHAAGRTGKDFAAPVYEYGRKDGFAIIGGVFYTGSAIPALSGKYLFGDHVSGGVWALDIPEEEDATGTVHALGGFHGNWITFGRDPQGEVYAATYGGSIYKLMPR